MTVTINTVDGKSLRVEVCKQEAARILFDWTEEATTQPQNTSSA